MKCTRILLTVLLGAGTCIHAQDSWRDDFPHELPLLGRQNWIIVGEPAFPLLNSTGSTLRKGADVSGQAEAANFGLVDQNYRVVVLNPSLPSPTRPCSSN